MTAHARTPLLNVPRKPSLNGRLRHALWAICFLLASCGGGGSGDTGNEQHPPPTGPVVTSFTSEQPGYFVGSVAHLTAVFQGGTGRIDPGNIAVTSGQPVNTPTLTDDVIYKLTVSNGTASVTRDLTIDVSYRDRMRTINMPFARHDHVALSLPDGRVLFIGGDSSGVALPSEIYQFDPVTEAFSLFGDMSTGRAAMIAVTLANGDVLVGFGGRSISQAPATEIINGKTGAVTPTAGDPLHQRYHAAATLLKDGRVLITGGFEGTGADRTAEIYDPTTGLFTLIPAMMNSSHYSHTATRLDDGRVLVYGGHTTDPQQAGPELFDPVTMTFTALAAPEPNVRALHAAVKTRDGRVWILGGEDGTSTPLATVLRFDPETFFAIGPNLSVPRTMLAGGALTDGRVVVSGGTRDVAGNELDATSDIVSTLQSRASGPAMSARRILHTVTALANGKLLIAGGYNNETGSVATAEIYE